MEYTKPSQLMVEVERILLTEWDPVGVKGEPMAEGEYGTFAGKVAAMLIHGQSEDEVADYLVQVESNRLGVGPNADRCHHAAHECKLLLA